MSRGWSMHTTQRSLSSSVGGAEVLAVVVVVVEGERDGIIGIVEGGA
jgi:hypothetical protein